jgi:hypothetical protein
MPYTVIKSKKKGDPQPYKIKNRQTGEIVGSSRTQTKAWASIKHREEDSKEQVKNFKKGVKKK